MIPNKALRLKCPHCGGEKDVISLISGNTFGGTLWSDQRFFAPMLPRVSMVQRCPHCGHYFFSYKQICNKHSNESTLNVGYVDYPHMKEAMSELLKSDMEKKNEFNLRLLMIQSYNDWFYRSNKYNGKPTKDEVKFHNDNIMKLIDSFPLRVDGRMYLKSDLLREAGMFDEAADVLPGKTDFNHNSHTFIDKEMSAIQELSTYPFVVWGKFRKLSLEMDYYDIHIGEISHHPAHINELLKRIRAAIKGSGNVNENKNPQK